MQYHLYLTGIAGPVATITPTPTRVTAAHQEPIISQGFLETLLKRKRVAVDKLSRGSAPGPPGA